MRITKDTNFFYMDASSTTPLHSRVIDEINNINKNYFGNPSSIHKYGVEAAKILEQSRLFIADSLKTTFDEVIFTSGATESINLAINLTASKLKPGRIVISAIEHPAVVECTQKLKKYGWEIKEWPVDQLGNIKLEHLDEMLSYPTKLVSIIWAQSEVGSIQPVQFIANECNKRQIIFHTDATQLIPHTLINFRDSNIDLLSASAHKFRGPKGTGLLLLKNKCKENFFLNKSISKQEFGIRSGTESVSLIAGMKVALEQIKYTIEIKNLTTSFPSSNILTLSLKLLKILETIKGVKLVGNHISQNRMPNHLSLLLSNSNGIPISSRDFVRKISEKGVYISSGSACSSASSDGSQVLRAMGYEEKWLRSCIRVSIGSWIDIDSLDKIGLIFEEVLSSYR